jgi:hypothetical protein
VGENETKRNITCNHSNEKKREENEKIEKVVMGVYYVLILTCVMILGKKPMTCGKL